MGRGFPPEFKEKVKKAVTVEELLKEHTDEDIYGRNFTCIMPDHQTNDSQPSMWYYSEDDNIYCYGCGEIIWDSISFMQQVENMSFKDAVFALADRANLDVPDGMGEGMLEERKRRKKLYNDAIKFWKNLKEEKNEKAKRGKEYLRNRNISEETINQFGIGFCPDKKLYANRDNIYYNFRDRIIFPIFDEYDKISGFAGRVLPEDNSDDTIKYINSSKKEISFFSKDILYGLNNAKRSIIKKKYAYLFEGYMDLITAFEHDVENAVAAMGTSIKDKQIKRLSELTTELIVYLDPDSAGLKAVIRAIDIFEKHGLSVKVIYSEDGKDPADKINELGEDFEGWAMEEARCPEQLYIDLYMDEYKDKVKEARKEFEDRKQSALQDLLKRYASAFEGRLDRIEVDFFLRSAAEELDMSYEALIKRLNKIKDSKGV